ncbi:uncharacterized protein LOC129593593 [Paramacrobiotus metropolitanus]|uniref:uncharacterized protein LOC129593593 n=1 Tax=Paramacrobiotus metropolitanus TaxID=2943436 RepID=UPI0024461F47|nr:uncharacterized protein LOC129593593 [Paramacrobiotus metropolitanus]
MKRESLLNIVLLVGLVLYSPASAVQNSKPHWQHSLVQLNSTTSFDISANFTISPLIANNENTTVGIIIPAIIHGESQTSEPAASDLLVGSSAGNEPSPGDADVPSSIMSHANQPPPLAHPLSLPFGMHPLPFHGAMWPRPPHPFFGPGMFPHEQLQSLNGKPSASMVEPKHLMGHDMRSGKGRSIGHAIPKRLLVEGQPLKLSRFVDGKEMPLNHRAGSRLRGNRKSIGTYVISGVESGHARAALKGVLPGKPVPVGDPLFASQNVLTGQTVTVLPGTDIDPTTQLFATTTTVSAIPEKPVNQTVQSFTVSENWYNANMTTTAIPGTTRNITEDYFNVRWIN